VIEEKLPYVAEYLQAQTIQDVNWIEVYEDLAALFWLAPTNPGDVIEPVWDIIGRCALSGITS
jgi:hypothetical protein